MRYLLLFFVVMICASCKKQTSQYKYAATYIYRNASTHFIRVVRYRSVQPVDTSFFLAPSSYSALSYSGEGTYPAPFHDFPPDSVAVVFDGTKKIMYATTGDNGFTKSRNMLNRQDTAYNETRQGPRTSTFEYLFTEADYLNAR
jgi:hypothetical protein